MNPIRNFGAAVMRFVLGLFLSVGCSNVHADEPAGSDEEPLILRHSLDLGVSYLESREADSLTGVFSYTYNLTSRSNISATLPYLDSDLDRDGGSGIGDLELVFNWSPGVDISAAPWIPKTAGTGVLAVLPTGNARDGRSLDSFILMPFIGLLVPVSEHLFLSPNFAYGRSLDETLIGEHVDLAIAEVGFVWLGNKGGWAGFYPSYLRDFETDISHYNYGVEVGKVFSSGIGLSVRYDDIEHFIPGSLPVGDLIFDQMITLNLHLVVGR